MPQYGACQSGIKDKAQIINISGQTATDPGLSRLIIAETAER